MPLHYGGFGSSTQVRLTRPNDVNTLTDLDLKCFPYPMTLAEWQKYLGGMSDTCKVIVLETGREAVGYASWEVVEEENSSYVNITRLGVHPNHRRQGYGSTLLESVAKNAARLSCDGLSILVPEIHCSPGDPDDVSAFLDHNGFRASGVIEYSYRVMYGDVIDGFYFVKEFVL